VAEIQEKARSKAEAFCSSERYKEMREDGAGYRLVGYSKHISPMSMYVLGGKDFVSESTALYGVWDLDKSMEMVRLMGEVANVTGRHSTFLDVGANIGWFSFCFRFAQHRRDSVRGHAREPGRHNGYPLPKP